MKTPKSKIFPAVLYVAPELASTDIPGFGQTESLQGFKTIEEAIMDGNGGIGPTQIAVYRLEKIVTGKMEPKVT